TKLIIDLRDTPGGFVTATRTVASKFIASGPIFWEEDADGRLTETKPDEKVTAIDADIDVVVLIDRGRASASEIVASAMQDSGRATLIGETSYGKGTVQQWIDLENDNGGLKLTVAKGLPPPKNWVSQQGDSPATRG